MRFREHTAITLFGMPIEDLLRTPNGYETSPVPHPKGKAKRLPRLNAESAKLAAAVTVLIDTMPGPGR